MPVTTSTEAGQRVQENATARRARLQAEAKRAADTLTPLDTIGNAPLETVPTPPAAPELAPQQTTLVISVTILHRGRLITIASEGRTLDAFCDLLDRRFGVPS